MNKLTTSTAIPTRALKLEALSNISASFELFCLASGMEALGEMMDHDARAICGPRHARGRDRRAQGKIGFHGGKVEIERPRLRGFDGKEQPIPSWEAAVAEDWLGKWAMNQILINVSTRKFASRTPWPNASLASSDISSLSSVFPCSCSAKAPRVADCGERGPRIRAAHVHHPYGRDPRPGCSTANRRGAHHSRKCAPELLLSALWPGRTGPTQNRS